MINLLITVPKSSPAVSRPWSPLTPPQWWPIWQHLYTRRTKRNSGCSGKTIRCGPSLDMGKTFRRYMWLQSPDSEVTSVSVHGAVSWPHCPASGDSDIRPSNDRLVTPAKKLPRTIIISGVMAKKREITPKFILFTTIVRENDQKRSLRLLLLLQLQLFNGQHVGTNL